MTTEADYPPLRPCPFCGQTPWGLFGPHEELDSFWVECHGNGGDCGDWHVDAGSRAEAADKWNRRAKL